MGTTIQAGKYDKRITFQLKTAAVDSTGGTTETWADAFTLWGSYEPERSDLLHTADKRFAETIAMFKFPYQPDKFIDATQHRIKFEADPRANPGVFSFWDIFPPLEKEYRELEIRARRYQ